MATHIAEHYAEELSDWRSSIEYYHTEMEDIENRLADVIRRNSITDIAEKTEAHQDLLNAVSERFLVIQVLINQQEHSIMVDDHFIEDEQVRDDTERNQQEIRKKMLEAEKAYIDAKYQCQEFISRTFKK